MRAGQPHWCHFGGGPAADRLGRWVYAPGALLAGHALSVGAEFCSPDRLVRPHAEMMPRR
jgi:hypothetical protein